MNKKRIFQVLAMALLTFTGAKAQSETMYIVQTVDGSTSVIEYPVSEIVSVVFTKPFMPLCPDNNHPHAIDLGLSVKWACCNVGASKPEEYGSRFNWGKIVDEENYEYYDGNESIQGDKDHDVATAILGSNWVTPTMEQLDELSNEYNCEWEWATTLNDIKGFKVKSKKEGYTDAYIFLPAAGYRNGSDVYYLGEDGYYWSSTPCESLPGMELPWEKENIYAYYLGFFESNMFVSQMLRSTGYSVRPVCP